MTYRKYGNRKVQIDGVTFDSIAEARRYQELKLLETAGEIKHLVLQPVFELQPKFKDAEGKTVAAVKYIADFRYVDELGYWIVEDVKGVETPVFKLKRKMFLYKYPDLKLRIVS